jgi:hypothetical protein
VIELSSTTRTQLYQALKTSFPDAKIDDGDLEALAICLQHQKDSGGHDLPPDLKSIDLSHYTDALKERVAALPGVESYSTPRAANDTRRYYWAKAVHTRKSPEGFEPFTGELGMARVTLDDDTPQNYRTAFGVIAKGDHLIDTVFEANQKYARHLGYNIERLDLITPARDVLRFGAISVFLGYKKKTDAAPSCYILEAGTATGQPKVVYLGKRPGEPINAYSGYKPTPFACPDHAYFGTLTVKDGDDPDRLHITSRRVENGVSEQPYIDVDIRWERQEGGLLNIWPGFLLARATGIVLSRKLSGKISQDCSEGIVPGAQ